ncbi:MAG: YbaN family protein [Gemmatimonadota bacterium]|nr:YbaN family protein [Gemmatimonadota bacterium]
MPESEAPETDNDSGKIHEPKDFSADVHLSGSKTRRFMFSIAGHMLVALAALGVFLPILPTTPLLLVAAACYARASTRFYNWLLNNRTFGPIILDWQRHRAIRLKHKVTAIVLIVATIGSSVWFVIPLLPIKILVALIGVGVITFLVQLPTRVEAD